MKKQENPYQVPSAYFDELESKVQSRIQTASTTFFTLPKLAFTLLLLAAVGVVVWQMQAPATTSDCMTLACIDDEAMMEEIMTYDDDLLYEYLTEEPTEDFPIDYTLDDLLEL